MATGFNARPTGKLLHFEPLRKREIHERNDFNRSRLESVCTQPVMYCSNAMVM